MIVYDAVSLPPPAHRNPPVPPIFKALCLHRKTSNGSFYPAGHFALQGESLGRVFVFVDVSWRISEDGHQTQVQSL